MKRIKSSRQFVSMLCFGTLLGLSACAPGSSAPTQEEASLGFDSKKAEAESSTSLAIKAFLNPELSAQQRHSQVTRGTSALGDFLSTYNKSITTSDNHVMSCSRCEEAVALHQSLKKMQVITSLQVQLEQLGTRMAASKETGDPLFISTDTPETESEETANKRIALMKDLESKYEDLKSDPVFKPKNSSEKGLSDFYITALEAHIKSETVEIYRIHMQAADAISIKSVEKLAGQGIYFTQNNSENGLNMSIDEVKMSSELKSATDKNSMRQARLKAIKGALTELQGLNQDQLSFTSLSSLTEKLKILESKNTLKSISAKDLAGVESNVYFNMMRADVFALSKEADRVERWVFSEQYVVVSLMVLPQYERLNRRRSYERAIGALETSCNALSEQVSTDQAYEFNQAVAGSNSEPVIDIEADLRFKRALDSVKHCQNQVRIAKIAFGIR